MKLKHARACHRFEIAQQLPSIDVMSGLLFYVKIRNLHNIHQMPTIPMYRTLRVRFCCVGVIFPNIKQTVRKVHEKQKYKCYDVDCSKLTTIIIFLIFSGLNQVVGDNSVR